jgi:hypothetical protein
MLGAEKSNGRWSWRQGHGRRVTAVAVAGLACWAAAGCQPISITMATLTVVSADVAIEGGSCGITLDAQGLQPSTEYGVGMYTTTSVVQLGTLQTDSAGQIVRGAVNYASDSLPRKYNNLHVAVYTLRGGDLGTWLANTQPAIAVCLASGLNP